ncbi:MAG: alpha/beta fold hydrolase [Desulfuromonadales bacterium]|nr:alpha/beta fold hydrolase [Desulfuromonadales bacterium]
MYTPTVIFSHGKESGPWGAKIKALAKIAEQNGCKVLSCDEQDNNDPEQRVSNLLAEIEPIEGEVILVGSSMGGYVAAVAAQQARPVGLFLMAPAIGLPGYAVQTPCPVARELTIVHGWDDDLIDGDGIVEFSRQLGAMLHLVPARHALLEQIDWLCSLFDLFLQRCLALESPVTRQGRLLASI